MSKLQKLVFFGNERLATGVSTDAPTLRALVKAGYDVAAVVSGPAGPCASRTKPQLDMATMGKVRRPTAWPCFSRNHAVGNDSR